MSSTNIRWHTGRVTPEMRAAALGQKGAAVWFTGLSGSGKSTLAVEFRARLLAAGRPAYVLDGDNLRHGLNGDLGFGPAARAENIRRVGHVVALFVDAAVITLAAFISPYRVDRDAARALVPPGHFFEVHVATPLEVCETRDPKGLYRRARAGEITGFTGLDAPYEAPEAPELVVDTAAEPMAATLDRLVAMLEAAGLLVPKG